jgi:hypothetical protein
METVIQEKRNCKRKTCYVPIEYRNLKDPEGPVLAAVAANISEGGLCFKSGEFISFAGRLTLEVILPTSKQSAKAIAKVVWIKKSVGNDHYEIGGRFLEMTKEDRASVASFCGKI